MSTRLGKRQKRLIIRTVIALVIIGFGFTLEKSSSLKQATTNLSPGTYDIVTFNDGDTITVDMEGREERIRMIGVDTPETQDPRKAVQCFGKAASQFTKDLIGNQPVRLEADATSGNRDRYNRLLRYVYLPDGRLVQAEIIKAGYGFAYTSFPFDKLEDFRQYQKDAREANRGLWSSCNPQQNKYGGYTSNDE